MNEYHEETKANIRHKIIDMRNDILWFRSIASRVARKARQTDGSERLINIDMLMFYRHKSSYCVRRIAALKRLLRAIQ